MHTLLLDNDVILDVACVRQAHFLSSQRILIAVEQKQIVGFLSAVSFPILYYLIRKASGHNDGVKFIHSLMRLMQIVEVDKATIERALQINLRDFEDSLQAACAENCSADFIVTRNIKDFKKSPVTPISPEEYLASFPLK